MKNSNSGEGLGQSHQMLTFSTLICALQKHDLVQLNPNDSHVNLIFVFPLDKMFMLAIYRPVEVVRVHKQFDFVSSMRL